MSNQLNTLKILIVEDNLAMLEVLKSVFKSFGAAKITTAYSGEEAYSYFCQHNHDIIVTDWMMEPCDGLELIRKIRNDTKSPNQYVPILLITGHTHKTNVINARDNGITDILVKPFNARDLYKRIEALIERPKQFVRTENFFGPDRRRKNELAHQGPFRRTSDGQQTTQIPPKEIDAELVDFI